MDSISRRKRKTFNQKSIYSIYKTCKFFSVLVKVDNELSKANRFFTCNINKAKYLLATKQYPPSQKISLSSKIKERREQICSVDHEQIFSPLHCFREFSKCINNYFSYLSNNYSQQEFPDTNELIIVEMKKNKF